MLHKITLPTGEEITFDWSAWHHQVNSSETQFGASSLRDSWDMYFRNKGVEYTASCQDGIFEKYGKHEKIQHLTAVQFPGGKIEVDYKTGHSPFMNSFTVRNCNERTVAQATLSYGESYKDSCLLQKVEMLDGGVYQFTYNSQYFEGKYAQDYWGYYNGKTTNASLVPYIKMKVYTSGNSSPYYQLLGEADRSINAAAMQANILTRVDYPTGGYTAYEYEPHRFIGREAHNVEIQEDYNFALNEGGGLRVKKMTTKADSDSEEIVYTYMYGIEENGLANSLDEPRLETFIDVYSSIEGNYNNEEDMIGELRQVYLKSTSDYLNYALNETPIWYSEVTEYSPKGKTVYCFKKHIAGNNVSRNFGKLYLTQLNTLFSQGPLLTQRTDYKQTGTLYSPIRKQVYSYETKLGRSNVYNLLIRRCNVNTTDFNLRYKPDYEYSTDKCRLYSSTSAYLQTYDCLERNGIYESNSFGISFKTEQLLEQRTVEYQATDSIVEVERYTYSNWLLKSREKSDGNGNIIETETRFYPFE
ncbi:MAG: hypothetical protein IJ494_04150 [Bacteroides sp.]|nr:hypothetical protein [Bacteroides sp.]